MSDTIAEDIEHLRRSEARLSAAFDAAPVGLVLTGPDAAPVRINPAYARITGFSVDELMAGEWRNLVHPDDLPRMVEQVRRMESGEVDGFSVETRYLCKDGSTTWVRVDVSRFRGPEGQVDHGLVVAEDIGDSREAEDRLRESEERYRSLFESISEGIAIYRVVRDDEGNVADLVVEDMNPAQELQMGRPREEVVGKALSDLYGPADVMRPYFDLAQRTIEARSFGRFEVYFEPTDAYYLATAFPLGDDRYGAAGMDVSDLRRAQAELKRRDEAIRRAYVDVLDAVTGGKLVLMSPEELRAALGERLIDERPITDRSQLGPAREEVRKLVAGSLADPNELLNPLGEALNNALKHAGSGSWCLFRDNDRFQAVVEDHGPGIDFRTLPKATLVPGFSTQNTLGMGFTIMLQMCDRVLLTTQSGLTRVALVVEADRPAPGSLG